MAKRRSSEYSAFDKTSVVVNDSPVSAIKQKGNLTGNVRVLRDHVAEICNLIQKWNTELLNGMAIISQIKDLVLDKIMETKPGATNESCRSRLQNLSNNLEKICENMEIIVEKLGQRSSNILSIHRLEGAQGYPKPLFLTWPTSKFVETSQDLYEMFRKEIEMKIMIKEKLCFCTDKSTLIFYSTAWFHQPYIEKSVNLNFEAMLKEVGLCSS